MVEPVFERLVLALVGGLVEQECGDGGAILGIVGSKRNRGDRCEIWVGGQTQETAPTDAWLESVRARVGQEIEVNVAKYKSVRGFCASLSTLLRPRSLLVPKLPCSISVKLYAAKFRFSARSLLAIQPSAVLKRFRAAIRLLLVSRCWRYAFVEVFFLLRRVRSAALGLSTRNTLS